MVPGIIVTVPKGLLPSQGSGVVVGYIVRPRAGVASFVRNTIAYGVEIQRRHTAGHDGVVRREGHAQLAAGGASGDVLEDHNRVDAVDDGAVCVHRLGDNELVGEVAYDRRVGFAEREKDVWSNGSCGLTGNLGRGCRGEAEEAEEDKAKGRS